MRFKQFIPITLFVLLLLLMLGSCKPKPIDIDVAQKPADMVIASSAFDEHAVFVSAGYSISSLANLNDTTSGKKPLPVSKDMLVDSGLVTIAGPGQEPETLSRRAPGLYSSTRLDLRKGASYTLVVKDYKTGKVAPAVTTYFPKPALDTLLPEIVRGGTTPTVKLRLSINDVGPKEYYMVCYTTSENVREATSSVSASVSALTSFVPKRVELFTSADAVNGRLSKGIVLNVSASDTLLVHCGRIDEAYYNYLAAYKRSGYLINQITGEPINLPTNINPGLGFFSLYAPKRELFLLKNY
jgi:hypothetical protein